MRPLVPESCSEIAVLGAHCDDIAIGAGGSLLELCRANPGTRVTALVLSGAGTPRESEERSALAAFCPKADLAVTVLDLRDGRFPAQWELAKEALEEVRKQCEPDLVFAPAPHDAHQDHRGLAKLVPTVFRNHLVLGYEILKWESDLAQPSVFFPLSEETVREKSDLLATHYPSQHGRGWFDHEAFSGLARVRGVQCQQRYAEAFHTPKLTIAAARSAN
ncbi:PIG-L family deacetylase [Amycolatopsis sp. AA4]|uniref:PIG-L deacetylase family protein n=1 Tax=Actinomycetes TaxID=1760 RepID=UPI0001B579E6|nr:MULTISPECIES: PIG-L deacetylase family protein [Actinomycetes]ATY09313.1 PIG-L family deacetylase [Amycolatopsis sp. AA4]EFL04635.1 GlcNAc-PI de-N-acetylase [Streptomyces sp. AA4]